MKRMLINATQREELRLAIVDGQTLYDLDIETPSREQKKANIYKGRITRIEPSLEACFVEYGGDRHGFLPLKEISRDYFKEGVDHGKSGIRDLLREGQEVIVQVDKEERGTKGAALTTFISLAGRYLVLMPNNPRSGGVSRRIEGQDRQEIREALKSLDVPPETGLIVRTAGVGRDAEDLQWDLDYLLQLSNAISEAGSKGKAPFLIHQESKLIIRALRDYLRSDIGEILVDNAELYADAREFMQQVMPGNLGKLKLYEDPTPLFSRFQIETQIETAFDRQVRLPSGGSIVIDQTEALTAIDINSARATRGSDIAETAFNTNCEAAVEIARQLRIRDAGGLIVIDFIDMDNSRHQREVEDKLKDALKLDRARVQVGRISRFGLLEMSRQRLRPSLGDSTQVVCPRCDGHGNIRGVESLSLSALRLVEEQAMKENTGQVLVQAPTTVANFLLNEKRAQLSEIEQRHKVSLVILANESLQTPTLEIQRLRGNEADDAEASYLRTTEAEPDVEDIPHALREDAEPQPAKPAVRSIVRAPQPVSSTPAPTASANGAAATNGSLLTRIMGWFRSDDADEGSDKPERQRSAQKTARSAPARDTRRGQRDGSQRDSSGNARGRNQRERGDNGARDGSAGGDGRRASGQRRSEQQQGRTRSERTERPARGGQQQTQQSQSQGQSQPAAQRQSGRSADSDSTRDSSAVNKQQTARGPQDGASAPKQGEQGGEQPTRSRRRGRRGGRRRRRSSGGAQGDPAQSGGSGAGSAAAGGAAAATSASTDKNQSEQATSQRTRSDEPTEQQRSRDRQRPADTDKRQQTSNDTPANKQDTPRPEAVAKKPVAEATSPVDTAKQAAPTAAAESAPRARSEQSGGRDNGNGNRSRAAQDQEKDQGRSEKQERSDQSAKTKSDAPAPKSETPVQRAAETTSSSAETKSAGDKPATRDSAQANPASADKDGGSRPTPVAAAPTRPEPVTQAEAVTQSAPAAQVQAPVAKEPMRESTAPAAEETRKPATEEQRKQDKATEPDSSGA